MKIYAMTDVGRRREVNQDYVYVTDRPIGPFPNLLTVADGMGGHKAGDFASSYTVNVLKDELKKTPMDKPEEILRSVVSIANHKLIEAASRDIKLEGMGTTLVVATVVGNTLYFANVGDSRLYVINRENVEWLVKHYAGRRLPFDMLVIDELSSFKNSRAKRFLALKKVLGQFSRVVGLTGTPAPNGLEDLWPQVFLLDRGQRLGRTMRSYLDLYFTTPNSWLPYKHELKPGAEEQIYKKLGDICVSMRAADHLQMPERIDNIVELTLSPREEKLYRQMERDMLLSYADGDVLALNAATLAGKLLQLSNGAVYDEFHNIRVIHDKKLDALEDLIEAANGKPVLVMYAYQHDLTRIQQRFGKYGPENPNGVRELKTSADLEDWNAGKISVAATQPASTGHGLNLQHGGSTIVWFGLNW